MTIQMRSSVSSLVRGESMNEFERLLKKYERVDKDGGEPTGKPPGGMR